MKARHAILLLQKLPELLLRLRKSCAGKQTVDGPLEFVGDIDRFIPVGGVHGRALIMLSPSAWVNASADYSAVRRFNVEGFTYEMVKVLNERGLIVDIVDLGVSGFVPDKRYRLFIGHGGNCRSILDALDPATTVVQYTSGAYWKEFNRLSAERYDDFCKRKGLPKVASFTRSLDGMIEGEEYLTLKADYLIAADTPRTIQTFGPYAEKFRVVGWAAYVEEDLIPCMRDFERGRKNFIYVAGTNGNIQKGLDLLLSAFVQTPDLHLYIFCKVEDEVYHAYRAELELPNIHYIYHLRVGPFRTILKDLFGRINYTISAPIDTGIGTAFIGSLGLGFIPVGYVDMVATESDSYFSESYEIGAIVKCIREVSAKPVAWCAEASRRTVENYKVNWSTEGFSIKFKKFLDEIIDEL